MLRDPRAIAGLVTREVRSGFRNGAATRIAVASRTYETDPSDLWDALTNPERIPRWFLPITGTLEVGGRYQFEGQAGGTIERCDKPNLVAVTWEYGPMVSWLEITLSASPSGTTLTLVHEAGVDPDMWEQFGPGAVGVGWDLAMMGLGLHLESGASVDPNEAAAFTLSAKGVEFVRFAATGWAAAAVADGDSADGSYAAAERTVTFYTVLPEGTQES
jgi:uncharacterized protein YndB with AHSA1/START domain